MKKLYACEEHIDEAIDEIVDKKETFPIIHKETKNKCSYCEKKSQYEVNIS